MTSNYSHIDSIKTGIRIRNLMNEKGVSVRDVTGILSVSNQTVYKWLNGQSLPTLENIYQLSQILHVSIDDMIVSETAITYTVPDMYVREEHFIYQA